MCLHCHSQRGQVALAVLPAASREITGGKTAGVTGLLLLLSLAVGLSAAPLTVCADPNNMPFSNQQKQGFENRIAEVIAADLGRTLDYVWWSQRRNFIRDTLAAGRCDAWIGVPSGLPGALTTAPYYRSSYVFVFPRTIAVTSLDDPVLAKLRIGVHVVGDAFAPPAQALARRGISSNVTGFSLFGDFSERDPAAKLIDAVARGDIDVAIAWGPLAGYFAKRQPIPLNVAPISGYEYDIGAAAANDNLKTAIEGALKHHRGGIQAILDRYSVPRMPRERFSL